MHAGADALIKYYLVSVKNGSTTTGRPVRWRRRVCAAASCEVRRRAGGDVRYNANTGVERG